MSKSMKSSTVDSLVLLSGSNGSDLISFQVTKKMLSPMQSQALGSQLFRDALSKNSVSLQGNFSKEDLLKFCQSMEIDWSDESIYLYMCEGSVKPYL